MADDAAVQASPWATKIKDAGTLRMGGSDAGPLFSMKDPATGKLTGFDAGLAQLLSHYITGKSDGPIALTISTVDTRETLVQNGTVDVVVATYSITPERAKKVAFAGPYYRSGDAVMIKTDTTGIKSVKDLDGKRVATQQGSTAADRITQVAPGADGEPVPRRRAVPRRAQDRPGGRVRDRPGHPDLQRQHRRHPEGRGGALLRRLLRHRADP